MEDTDKSKFAALMTGLSDYYSKSISPTVIKVYWQGLFKYDYPSVEKAMWEHTQNPDTGQFMPKIADVTRVLQGSTIDQAALAWTKVDQAVRQIGTDNDVVFDDPLIHRVILDMGGWVKLGTIKDDEWKFTENHFRTRYKGYKLTSDIPLHPLRLTGVANMHNGTQGFATGKPVLIGNAQKAQLVLEGKLNNLSLGNSKGEDNATPNQSN